MYKNFKMEIKQKISNLLAKKILNEEKISTRYRSIPLVFRNEQR